MAYSGTQTFNLSIEEIIQEAHERCQLQVGEGYDLKTAKRSLNLMFAEWANRGLNLWTIEYATQTLTAGTNHTYLQPLLQDETSSSYSRNNRKRGRNDDELQKTVHYEDSRGDRRNHFKRRKQHTGKSKVKSKSWIKAKKERQKRQGKAVRKSSKYTGRRRPMGF